MPPTGGACTTCGMAGVLKRRFSSRSLVKSCCIRATVSTSISTGNPISFWRSRPLSRGRSSGNFLGTARTPRGEPWLSIVGRTPSRWCYHLLFHQDLPSRWQQRSLVRLPGQLHPLWLLKVVSPLSPEGAPYRSGRGRAPCRGSVGSQPVYSLCVLTKFVYHWYQYIYIYSQGSQSNILQNSPNSELRLRTPSPEYQSTLRHRGAQYPTGLHILLRTGRDITNVADLWRDSQKALPRSYLGSLDSVVYKVTSSGDHTITIQNTL